MLPCVQNITPGCYPPDVPQFLRFQDVKQCANFSGPSSERGPELQTPVLPTGPPVFKTTTQATAMKYKTATHHLRSCAQTWCPWGELLSSRPLRNYLEPHDTPEIPAGWTASPTSVAGLVSQEFPQSLVAFSVRVASSLFVQSAGWIPVASLGLLPDLTAIPLLSRGKNLISLVTHYFPIPSRISQHWHCYILMKLLCISGCFLESLAPLPT